MKRLITFIGFLIIAKFGAQTWKTDDQYIQKFARYAVEEMEKYKIPASITLAQGLLETGGGQSRLALEGNNHFGIKCKEEWTGKTMKHTDDAPNECFRVYDDPRESYEDHSKFLAYRKYYVNLFKLDPKDYKAWAHGLKKAGYATNPRYAYILINKIEKYKLYEFDNVNAKQVDFALLKLYPDLKDDQVFMAKNEKKKETPKAKPAEISPYKSKSYKKPAPPKRVEKTMSKYEVLNTIAVKKHPNGGMKFFVVPQDIEMSLVAKKFGVSESRLKKYNETESELLKKNDIVFLEYKKPEGKVATYKAENGETMHDISQKFGIRLNRLYYRNRMASNEQPRVGELIYLQGRKPN